MAIKPFRGDSEDDQLLILTNFLVKLSEKADVRPVMENFLNFKIKKRLRDIALLKSRNKKIIVEPKFIPMVTASIDQIQENQLRQENSDCLAEEEEDLTEEYLTNKIAKTNVNKQNLAQNALKSLIFSRKSEGVLQQSSSNSSKENQTPDSEMPETPTLPFKTEGKVFKWRGVKFESESLL